MTVDTLAADVTAAVRRECTPPPGTPGTCQRHCRRCDMIFTTRKRGRIRYCPPCAHQRHVESTVGISRREGPAWEALVRGQLRRWVLEAEKLGLVPAEALAAVIGEH